MSATIPPPEDASWNHQYAQINGIRMHYVDVGPRDGLPLVLVHGFPDLWYGWKHQIVDLRETYRVIVADNRGYAGTDAPAEVESYRRKTTTDDYAQLLDHLDIKQAVFIGHDWGGDVVWKMCLFHPDRVLAVAAVCTPYFPPSPVKLTLEETVKKLPEFEYQLTFSAPETPAIYDAHASNFFNAFYGNPLAEEVEGGLASWVKAVPNLKFKLSHPPLLSPEELQYYIDQYLRQGFFGPLCWYRTGEMDWDDLTTVESPIINHRTLFVLGTDDKALRPYMSAHMEKFIPNLTRESIEGGHWLLNQKPQEINAILRKWLEPLTAAS
ncbi:unnamed protein product [Aphanomyces euteiches]|uniref:AB hydrolase-1 domain-containing protein n=1 Tax=Aphanomyces euteiches TaxID=100861 RepID=A0A6G0WS67_9STRA|nr:hypothetical protein Ae201684_012317 [Aphanomyces euteiches]KAH9135639.1 hypothetical protein AeRB84_019015 [Aphanomyces euteiches]